MTKELTPLQADILRLAQTRDLSKMTYREMAKAIDIKHPYSVQQAMVRLIDKGLLMKNKKTGTILSTENNGSRTPLLSIPVLGRVSCGPAAELAVDYPSNFVSVSPSVARIRKPEITFALVASGDSMSAANINGKTVDDGDYVIIEKRQWGEASDGDYVVSRFNELNNLKKIRVDRAHNRIVLLSESVEEQPPIIIAAEDIDYYGIEGIAIDVVKGLPDER
ncbi:MAG: S24 family peptidase [Candidatus Saccharimonadales bacterium]